MAVRITSGVSSYARLIHGTQASPDPIIPSNSPQEPFTVFCRIKVHAVPGGLGGSIIKFDRIPPGFGGNLDYLICAIFGDGAGGIQFATVSSDFSSDDTALSDPKNLEQSYNVTFVFASDSERHIIVDGVLEDTNTALSTPNGLEGIIIGTSYTAFEDTYNKPVGDICIEELTVWRNAKTAEDVAPLNAGGPTTALDITNIILRLPFADEASIGDAFEYVSDPGNPTPVSMTVEEGDGEFSDEEDCFEAVVVSGEESGCPSSGFDLVHPPCVTAWTQCVKIQRRDGVSFRFTSLDQDIEFRGETYVTCGGLDPSATQVTAQLGEVGSSELAGLMVATGVDEQELYGGLFDDAFVEIWLVPFDGAFDTSDANVPRRLSAGWAGKVSHSTRGYKMEVLGPGARLDQRPIVQVYSPQCRWVFGDERCTIDIDALAISGTVSSALNRGLFTAALGAEASSGTGAAASSGELTAQFANGRVRWLTGVNAGQVTEVKSVDFNTGQIILWALTCFVPEAGDTFDLLPGCAQDFPTCRDLYDDAINFGGFPHTPGRDAIMESPSAKVG